MRLWTGYSTDSDDRNLLLAIFYRLPSSCWLSSSADLVQYSAISPPTPEAPSFWRCQQYTEHAPAYFGSIVQTDVILDKDWLSIRTFSRTMATSNECEVSEFSIFRMAIVGVLLFWVRLHFDENRNNGISAMDGSRDSFWGGGYVEERELVGDWSLCSFQRLNRAGNPIHSESKEFNPIRN